MFRNLHLRSILGLGMLCGLWLPLAGCQSGGLYIPDGDAHKGREVYTEMGCYTCHQVRGEQFPEPVASPPVPVVLGSPFDKQPRRYLFESIIAPSHRFARPRPTYSEPPFEYSRAEYENIRSGTLSRMGDYSQVLTVRELLDLVSYLESLQDRTPAQLAGR